MFLFYILFSEESAIYNNRIFFGRYFSPFYEYLYILFYVSIYITQLLFFRFFLNSPTYYKHLDRWINILIGIVSVLLLADLICFALFGEQQIYLTLKDSRYIILLPCILYPVYLIYKSKDKLASIVITGTLSLILFSLIGGLFKYVPVTIRNSLSPLLQTSNNYPIFGALIEYTLFSVGLGYRMRIIEQRNQQLANKVELEQMRQQFYANITHEFRTPLTLIISPLQEIINGTMVGDLKIQHKRMLRNARRLLQLINQLLDVSKQTAVQAELDLEAKEIQTFLRALVFSFESVAMRKQIKLDTTFPTTQFIQVDVNKLESILSNLLSNAFKFTPEGGSIQFKAQLKGENLQFSVGDSGIGIAETELPYIFDRFYQASHDQQLEGSGIGLWTVHQLVEAYSGKIEVHSTLGKGTNFSVTLPIKTAVPTALKTVATKETTAVEVEHEDTTSIQEKSQILLAEDNKDLRAYIKEVLIEKYTILEAENGYDAWLLAKEVLPDLIITDVMMPEMDGLTLTQKLRDSHLTDHIPIIILTAKAYSSDKLEGLRSGAEAYLTKPFNAEELQIRIEEMLKQRTRLRRAYAEKLSLHPSEIEIISKDDQFLNDLLRYVESEIDNPDFEIEAMAKHVNMSRSQLYRKLKAIMDVSPSVFVRNIRLERAKQLLLQKKGTISEVAFDLGFSSLAYFTKLFKEKFGVSPSQYQKNNTTNN